MKSKHIAGLALAALLCAPVVLKLTRSEPARKVDVEVASLRNIKSSILASGHLLYEEQVVLSPEVIGKVDTIFVKEGQVVKSGELLLHLNDQSYRAEVAQHEAAVRQQRISIQQQQLAVANQEQLLKRKAELHRMKMIAEIQYDEARYGVESAKIELLNSRSRLDQAEAMLKQSRERLDKTNIRSPISGTITSLDIKVGETALAGQVSIAGASLMTIANTTTMISEVNVDEADIAKIRVGQEVGIHTAAYSEVAIKGEVVSIPLSPKKNGGVPGQGTAPLTRDYNIKVKLGDTKGLTLRPGMSCRTEIFTANADKALAVPVQAILSNNDENTDVGPKRGDKAGRAALQTSNHVFIDKDGKAEKRIVTLGNADDSHQQIVSGVAAGETVITGPYKILRHLKQGDRVSGEASKAAALRVPAKA
jgi:HlyD family secretion protein